MGRSPRRGGRALFRPAVRPSDAERPLIARGERQARRLRSVLPRLDRLFSSPLLRAAQTAAPLADLAPGGAETLAALADAEAAELPETLTTALRSGLLADARPAHVAIVGHEPQLSEAIGMLITNGDLPATVRMRKGSVARLSGTLKPGGMMLELLLSQGDLKRLN